MIYNLSKLLVRNKKLLHGTELQTQQRRENFTRLNIFTVPVPDKNLHRVQFSILESEHYPMSHGLFVSP